MGFDSSCLPPVALMYRTYSHFCNSGNCRWWRWCEGYSTVVVRTEKGGSKRGRMFLSLPSCTAVAIPPTRRSVVGTAVLCLCFHGIRQRGLSDSSTCGDYHPPDQYHISARHFVCPVCVRACPLVTEACTGYVISYICLLEFELPPSVQYSFVENKFAECGKKKSENTRSGPHLRASGVSC